MSMFARPHPGTPRIAAKLLVVVLIPSTVVTAVFGNDVGMAFGFAIGIGMAVSPVIGSQLTAASATITGMLAGLATVAHDDPGQVAALMLLAAVLMALTNQHSAGLMTLAPIVVILYGPGPVDLTWLSALGWTMLGGLSGLAVTRMMGFRGQPRPVPQAVAWRHAATIGALSAATMCWALANDVAHGYWIAVTVLVALRPLPEERRDTLRGRLVGTLLGTLIALLVIVTLPTLPAAVVAAGCLFLLATYAMGGSYFMQTLFLTPMLLVFASLGDTGKGITYTAERALYTTIGAAIGVLAAVVLARFDRTDPALTEPEDCDPAGRPAAAIGNS